MTAQRDSRRLKHILQACREIQQFTENTSKEGFLSDRLLQRGVEKDLEIIGEAANNLSEETKTELSSVPWKKIIGMRNILIHVYFEVDLDTVWETIREDIPVLIQTLENESI